MQEKTKGTGKGLNSTRQEIPQKAALNIHYLIFPNGIVAVFKLHHIKLEILGNIVHVCSKRPVGLGKAEQ